MPIVVDIAWIERGVPKQVPDRVKLSAAELRHLVEGETVDECNDEEHDEEEAIDNDETLNHSSNEDVSSSPTSNLDRYNLEEYDADHLQSSNTLSKIAVHATPLEDVYVTEHVDSDEEDRQDFEIKRNDNLVVVAKAEGPNDNTLEVHVYNEDDGDWYIHHDYLLEDVPLCLEPISCDPGSESNKGNLIAVGSAKPVIAIWDLDIVNASSPVVSLGKVKSKRGKRDGSSQGHTNAVLCLSWNRLCSHVLASGSADNTVVLWDIEEAKPSSISALNKGMVQSIQWHPNEDSILLGGTNDGYIILLDCRDSSVSKEWSISEGVERVLWNRFDPFYYFISTDKGILHYMDTRSDSPVFSQQAHCAEVHSISQCPMKSDLIATCGLDSEVNIWKLSKSGFNLVHNFNPRLGPLQSIKFSPDSLCVAAIGGDSEDMLRVVSLSRVESVRNTFDIDC